MCSFRETCGSIDCSVAFSDLGFSLVIYFLINYYLQAITAFNTMAATKSLRFADIVKCYEDQKSSGEFHAWLEKLELVAELQGVTDLAKFLPLFLGGPAFAVYQQLGDAVKQDYHTLKAELRKAFTIDSFTAYEQLKDRVLREDEAVDSYLADIQRLVTLMGHKDDEVLTKCPFVSGLPSGVALQLKSAAGIEKLHVTDVLARTRAILASGQFNSAFVCAGVKSNLKAAQCYTCSQYGHLARECPNRQFERPTGHSKHVGPQRRCFVCNAPNHLANKCPQRSGNAGGGTFAPRTSPESGQ